MRTEYLHASMYGTYWVPCKIVETIEESYKIKFLDGYLDEWVDRIVHKSEVRCTHPKEELALRAIEDLVADYLYYSRKEDEDLTVSDMEELLTQEFIEKAVSKFREQLEKNR